MKILHLLHVLIAQWFYEWALAEINPQHPDVPMIVRRRMELSDKFNRLFA